MNPWEWLTTTTTPDSLLTTLGVGTLAILFATDRILTRGAHARRTADLVAGYEQRIKDLVEHHARELAEKDRHVERVDESRGEWKAAAAAERERAQLATETVATMASSLDGIKHVLDALHDVAKETTHD